MTSGWGFLYPAALISIPLGLAVLVYVYRQRAQGKAVIVPTLLLLKQLSKQSRARKRFVPPLRFYFELLCLLLLGCALAGFYEKKPAGQIALLIDNSLSMGKIISNEGASTDLAKAIEAAENEIRALSTATKIEIFTTSPALLSLTNGFVGPNEALVALTQISLAFAPDKLDSALSRLSAQSQYDKILAFTDKQSAQGELSDQVRIVPINEVRSTEALSNLAFTSIQYDDSVQPPLIKLNIAAYSSGKSIARVILKALHPEKQLLEKIAEEEVALPALGNREISIPVSSSAEAFEAELILLKSGNSAAVNALQQDDNVWIARGPIERKVLFVGPIAPEQLGLRQIKLAHFIHQLPEEFEKAPSLPEDFAAALFHRFTPAKFPRLASIQIDPPASSKESDAKILSSWDATHPVLRYLALSTLQLPQYQVVTPPSWSKTILNVESGPIAYAGENSGMKQAVFGFELLPFEGKKSPVVSILLLNALKYVLGENSASGYLSLQDYKSGSSEMRRLGDKKSFNTESQTAEPGLYTFKGGIQALNYIDPEESNFLENKVIAKPTLVTNSRADLQSTNRSDLLALLVAFLLIADLFFIAWRKNKSAERGSN